VILEKDNALHDAYDPQGLSGPTDPNIAPPRALAFSYKGGKPAVKDGPFTEAKEVVGGYWMIQVK
jgi:hypothetical protein